MLLFIWSFIEDRILIGMFLQHNIKCPYIHYTVISLFHCTQAVIVAIKRKIQISFKITN